jgi:serine/threonine protein kinase
LVEARILAEVKHQHVVRLHDSGVLSDGTAYLAMELLAGRDLAHHLNESGPLPISLALTITLQVGKALAAAHHCGIVHRDIKPQNIIVCREGPSDQVHAKVIDFGLAKVPLGSGREHSDGIIIGSLEFLAPEATLGFSALVDARADQWALAVLAYRMLSGVLPFSLGPDPMAGLVRIRSAPVRPLVELRPDIPACVERVILRALSKDKELRFPNMEQFIHALNQAAESTGLAHITSTRSAGDD